MQQYMSQALLEKKLLGIQLYYPDENYEDKK